MLISALSLILHQILMEKKNYLLLESKLRDGIEFFIIMLIWIIGKWGLKENVPKWISSIWNISYYLALTLILIAAIIDWIFHYSNPEQFRFNTIKGIFWSPLPFLVVAFLSYSHKKRKTI